MVLEKKLKRKGEHVWLIEWWQSILERVYCTVYSYRLQRVLVEVRQLTQKTPNRRVVGANIEHWKSTWGKCIVKEDVSRDFNLQFFLMNTPGSLINRLKFFSNLGFRFHRYIWIRKKLHPQHTKTPRFLTTVELKFSNFAIEYFNKSTLISENICTCLSGDQINRNTGCENFRKNNYSTVESNLLKTD